MFEYTSERLAQINDGSLTIDELSAELESTDSGDLIKKLSLLPRPESLAWARKLNREDFLEYRPKMLKRLDPRFKKADLMDELGATSDQNLLEIFSEIGKDLASIWIKKLNMSDYALMNAKLGGIAYRESKAVEQGVSGGTASLDKVLATAGLTAGALGAGAVERMMELMKGSEQTYNANLLIDDIQLAFEAALQGDDIRISSARENGDAEVFTFVGQSEKVLLKLQVQNTQVPANMEESAYDATHPREVGRCMIRITESDMGGLLEKGMAAIGEMGKALDMGSARGDELSGVLASLFIGAKRSKEAFDVVNLPRLLSVTVEKLAQKAEDEASHETKEIKRHNRARLEEVKKGLECESCDTPRPREETPSCGACGGTLSKRGESVARLESDRVKLAEVGLTF